MITDIEAALRSYRFRFSTERELQDGVAEVLKPFELLREYQVNGAGIIDFYQPQLKLGIECKIKGSVGPLLRQLNAYAGSDDITHLMVVTDKSRLAIVPESLNCKPLIVVGLWGQLL